MFLRDLKKRGMRAPVLAVGDCALGFWSALRYVFPKTRHQRDWVHKSANVLGSLPKSVHRRAKGAIKEITRAENKIEASIAIEALASEFGAKWPKAVSKITSEKETLLAFYDYPAEHRRHLMTTNLTRRQKVPLRSLTEEERNLLVRISRSHAEPASTSLGPRLCSAWRKVRATPRQPKQPGVDRGVPSRSWCHVSTEKA